MAATQATDGSGPADEQYSAASAILLHLLPGALVRICYASRINFLPYHFFTP